jgi:hypothetical protein
MISDRIRIIKHEPSRRVEALRSDFLTIGPANSSVGMIAQPADFGRIYWTAKLRWRRQRR